MNQSSEKRTNYRNFVNQPLQLVVKEHEDEVAVNGFCIDVSDGGLAVELPHAVAVGTEVRISNDFDMHSELAICLNRGTVIRCQEQGNQRFLIAINFQ